MARAANTTASTRAPRGTRTVSQAFFQALDSVPESARPAVAKAAQIMIRDELKNRRDKLKAAAAKAKARQSAATTREAKGAAAEVSGAAGKPAPTRSRARKRSEVPAAA